MDEEPNQFEDGYEDVILLGIDGNCAYALHGKTFETGEAEFIELTNKSARWSDEWMSSARRKALQAGCVLSKRLGIPRRFGFDENLSPDGAC